MKYFLPVILVLYNLSVIAQHTFSIVAIDPVTGIVGSAGASCIDSTPGNPEGVAVISGIIPGKGAINSQAQICIPNINLINGLIHMSNGLSPDEIIDTLKKNDACIFGDKTYRQYGIVDLDNFGNPRSAAFTGTNAQNYKGHWNGSNFAIQGNILIGAEVLDSMAARFLRAKGGLAHQLMYALQGANIPGADSRCLAEGVSSLSAYIRVALPGDDPDSLYIDLLVPSTPFGKEPIDSLQRLFDSLHVPFDTGGATGLRDITQSIEVKVYPNPGKAAVRIQLSGEVRSNPVKIEIVNSSGVKVFSDEVESSTLIEVPAQNGLYFYTVSCDGKLLKSGKVIVQ